MSEVWEPATYTDEAFRREGACECGCDLYFIEFDRSGHARRHKRFSEGVSTKARSLAGTGDRIIKVAGAGSSEHQPAGRLAYNMAQVASRAAGRGSTFYPGDPSTDAYLFLRDNTAIGYLSVKVGAAWFSVSERVLHEEPIPCAYEVFVCRNHRRTGVATALINRFAEDSGCAPHEVSWGYPFTRAGYVLGRAIAGDRMRVT